MQHKYVYKLSNTINVKILTYFFNNILSFRNQDVESLFNFSMSWSSLYSI